MKWLLLSIAPVLCCFASALELRFDSPLRLTDASAEGESTAVDVLVGSSQGPFTLNVQWYPLNPKEWKNFAVAPEIILEGIDSNGNSKQLHVLNSSVAALLDDNYWPIRLNDTYAKFRLRLPRKFDYLAALNTDNLLNPIFDLPMIAMFDEHRLGATIEIDPKKVGLEVKDKFLVEVSVCKGKMSRIEVVYTTHGSVPEKVRKSEIPHFHGERAYLIPLEVYNRTVKYVIDLFGDKTTSESAVYRIRLAKLNPKILVNLAAMHQTLDNLDYPAGVKIPFDADGSDLELDLRFDEYLLNISNTSNPISYGIVATGLKGDDVTFRRMCTCDYSAVFTRELPRTLREFVPVEKYALQRNAVHQFAFAKQTLLKGQQRFSADSGTIDAGKKAAVGYVGTGTGKEHHDQKTQQDDFLQTMALGGLGVLLLVGGIYGMYYTWKQNKLEEEKRSRVRSSKKPKFEADPEESKKFIDNPEEARRLVELQQQVQKEVKKMKD